MIRHAMDRRRALRGIVGGVGVALGLPMLEAMLNSHGTALAAGNPLPRRFGVWFWGNGVRPERFFPTTTGANWETTPELVPLDVALQNGERLKSYINVVSNLETRLQGAFSHYPGGSAILAGAHNANAKPYGNPAAATIDQVVAQQWAGQTRLRSLQMAVAVRGDLGLYQNDVSWLGDNAPNSLEFSPAGMYQALFGGLQSDLKNKLGRKSVLDVVQQDLRRLRQRAGRADAQRLDEHAQNVRQIEQDLDRLISQPGTCGGSLASVVDPASQIGVREPLRERHRLFADMLTVALACDMTRVFALQFHSIGTNVQLWQAGAGSPHHGVSHDVSAADPQTAAEALEVMHKSVVFTMTELSYLAQKLANTPEGTSNLLAQSCIFATSEVGNGTTHALNDHPVLLLGGAGGGLRTPGQHIRFARPENATRLSLTAMRAVGAAVDSFGVEDAMTSQSVAEVLA